MKLKMCFAWWSWSFILVNLNRLKRYQKQHHQQQQQQQQETLNENNLQNFWQTNDSNEFLLLFYWIFLACLSKYPSLPPNPNQNKQICCSYFLLKHFFISLLCVCVLVWRWLNSSIKQVEITTKKWLQVNFFNFYLKYLKNFENSAEEFSGISWNFCINSYEK